MKLHEERKVKRGIGAKERLRHGFTEDTHGLLNRSRDKSPARRDLAPISTSFQHGGNSVVVLGVLWYIGLLAVVERWPECSLELKLAIVKMVQ